MSHSTEEVKDNGVFKDELKSLLNLLKHPKIKEMVEEMEKENNQ